MPEGVQVVDSHDRESPAQRLEVASIVAFLLTAMPLATIHLDDHPALDKKIDTPDSGNHDLRFDSQSGVTQCDPDQRLNARLRTRVEVSPRQFAAAGRSVGPLSDDITVDRA